MYTLFLMAQQPQADGAAPNPIIQFLPLILLFVIFYIFILMPQQRKQKKHQQMIDSLERGDNIVTSGGIVGQIIGKKGDLIVIKSGETKLEISKGFITDKVKDEVKTS